MLYSGIAAPTIGSGQPDAMLAYAHTHIHIQLYSYSAVSGTYSIRSAG